MSDNSDGAFYERVAKVAEEKATEHDEGCPMHHAFKQVAQAARACATECGPAQVSTPAYRDGWDSIFGKRMPLGSA